MQEDAAHLQNKASIRDPSDTWLTQRRSLKVLADQVENGAPALKQARGFYLRKMFKAFNTQAVYAEDGTK